MSQLGAYLRDNSLRQAEFAAKVGATQGTISRLIKGDVLPSLDLAVKIERATAGVVPATSWVAASGTREDAA